MTESEKSTTPPGKTEIVLHLHTVTKRNLSHSNHDILSHIFLSHIFESQYFWDTNLSHKTLNQLSQKYFESIESKIFWINRVKIFWINWINRVKITYNIPKYSKSIESNIFESIKSNTSKKQEKINIRKIYWNLPPNPFSVYLE